jgi:hypothetical protein
VGFYLSHYMCGVRRAVREALVSQSTVSVDLHLCGKPASYERSHNRIKLMKESGEMFMVSSAKHTFIPTSSHAFTIVTS